MSHQHHDRFFRVPRTVQRTSQGLVDLPILYYDVRNVVAIFEARRDGVEAVLAGTGLVPGVLTRRDGALVGMSFYEYRDTSVGVYNEVGTAIFAVRQGERRPRLGIADLYRPVRRRQLGAYVLDLPVTTPLANAAGREIWGYPKFVTEIPFAREGRRVETAVLDPDGQGAICTLSGAMGPGIPGPPLSLMTYTLLEGSLIRTHVDVRGTVEAHGAGSVSLRVGSSRHRMAENLRTLGLEEARPLFLMATDRFQSKLWPGSRVGTRALDGDASEVPQRPAPASAPSNTTRNA